jgi:hypothetical protein
VVITEHGRPTSACTGIKDYVFPDNPYGFQADRERPPEPYVLRAG